MHVVTFCEKCHAVAPILIDSSNGFIGYLSTDITATDDPSGRQCLGYVYAGLEAVGLTTYGMVLFREFVARHQDHGATTSVSEDADELVRVTEWLEDAEGPQDDEDEDEPPPGWVWGTFEVRCKTCKKRRRCFALDVFEDRDDLTIDTARTKAFVAVARVLPHSFHQDEPLELSAISELAEFLGERGGHDVSHIVRER